jgi:hypothetical protein
MGSSDLLQVFLFPKPYHPGLDPKPISRVGAQVEHKKQSLQQEQSLQRELITHWQKHNNGLNKREESIFRGGTPNVQV